MKKFAFILFLFIVCILTSACCYAKEIKCDVYYPKNLIITDTQLIITYTDYEVNYTYYCVSTKHKTYCTTNLISMIFSSKDYFNITLVPSDNIKDKITAQCK